MGVTYTDQSITSGNAVIQDREDYRDTAGDKKTGDYNYWSDELKGSLKMLRRWHRQADKINQRYLDQRISEASSSNSPAEHGASHRFKINLFYSNVSTLTAMLYGNIPKIDVKRRHEDAKDDIARVAAEILERMLNNDTYAYPEEYESVFKAVLQDRLVPGLGVCKVGYDLQVSMSKKDTTTSQVDDPGEADNVTQIKRVQNESAPLEYFHWRDILWSWSRTFADIRWIAFRTFLTKPEMTERFGEKIAEAVPYKQQKMVTDDTNNETPNDPDMNEQWLKAEIWEIWDKKEREVVHLNLGYDKVLDCKPDPLKLRNFFPTPPFFIANATTSLYTPTPDFHMAQDLYTEVDKLQTRVSIITEAVKVVGVYDATNPEIQRMMKEGTENDLIPVDKWAMFAEKGGLQGTIDWFPIQDVVNALVQLRQIRDETIALLYQVTGVADVMRGQLDNQYEGVGQTDTKTKLGSVRVQALQESYATFASDLMTLKAEIISKHFDAKTIAEQANVSAMFDEPEVIQQAIALIKSPGDLKLRVKIKAESLAMVDWNRLKQERTEYLTALATFMQSSAPLIEQSPAAAPFLLELLQWGLSGFRGGDEIEGVIDQAIQQINTAQQEAQDNPQPDPETQRLQAQGQLEQQKAQAAMQLVQAKGQAAIQERQADMFADIQTHQAEHKMKMAEREADLQSELAQLEARAIVEVITEKATSQINSEQNADGIQREAGRDVLNHGLEIQKIAAASSAKIREMRVTAEVKRIPTPKPEGDSDND